MDNFIKSWICVCCKEVTSDIHSVSGDYLGTCRKCHNDEYELKEFLRKERNNMEDEVKCKILLKYKARTR